MLDDIREWISDNLRYILLGLAGILVILIIVFAVRLIGGHKKSGDENPKKEAEATVTEETKSSGSDTAADNPITTAGDALERNQKDVLDLVTRFYTAKLNQDYDTLEEICEVVDDQSDTGSDSLDNAVEAYNNLMTYSKSGLTPGSYVAFVYFDAKVTGIDTLIPALRGFYLVTDEEGSLIISDIDSHADQKAYLEQVGTDDDVQVLRKDVADRYEDSIAQDPDLAKFVESMESGQTNNGDTAETDGEGTGDDAADDGEGGSAGGQTGTMYASTGVNVRSEPSTEATKYGALQTGMQVEVLENLDNGWSHIRYYSVDGSAVEGYVMTQYLTDAQ